MRPFYEILYSLCHSEILSQFFFFPGDGARLERPPACPSHITDLLRWHTCHPSTREVEAVTEVVIDVNYVRSSRPSLGYASQRQAGFVDQLVECFTSVTENLGLIRTPE